jgi:AraC-like DNA-binding protein
VPHQVLESNHLALLCGLEIPLAWYLHWNLPSELTHHLLGGKILYEHSSKFSDSDAALTGHWRDDINSSSASRRRAVLLEIEARLWRFADSQKASQGRSLAKRSGILGDIEVSGIEKMAGFIAENYTRPLHVREVAGVVDLHPNYAMKLFSKGFGSNFNNYLNQFRVAHAQRLLSLSDAKITEIAKASGFGSLSRFNSNFRQITGLSPRAYRSGMSFPLPS